MSEVIFSNLLLMQNNIAHRMFGIGCAECMQRLPKLNGEKYSDHMPQSTLAQSTFNMYFGYKLIRTAASNDISPICLNQMKLKTLGTKKRKLFCYAHKPKKNAAE